MTRKKVLHANELAVPQSAGQRRSTRLAKPSEQPEPHAHSDAALSSRGVSDFANWTDSSVVFQDKPSGGVALKSASLREAGPLFACCPEGLSCSLPEPPCSVDISGLYGLLPEEVRHEELLSYCCWRVRASGNFKASAICHGVAPAAH